MDRSTAMERIRVEAATHPDGCNCTTCKAADGDTDAFNRLYKELA